MKADCYACNMYGYVLSGVEAGGGRVWDFGHEPFGGWWRRLRLGQQVLRIEPCRNTDFANVYDLLKTGKPWRDEGSVA